MSHDAVGRTGTRLAVVAILAAAGIWAARPLKAASPLGPWSGPQIAMAGAGTVWQIQLPLRATSKVRSYHLVDGYLYALCDDGHVHCIRPDIGRLLWTRRLAELFETLWPPVVHHGATGETVAFTLLREIVFLAPNTGQEIKRLRLPRTNNAAIALSVDQVFQPSTNKRLRCLHIDRGIEQWQVRAPELLEMAPQFVPQLGVVVFVDQTGTLAEVDTGGTKVFARSLGGRPEGWLLADDHAAYVATVDRHLHVVSLANGELLGQFRLADLPVGGPVVAGGKVYQATTEGGLHCFSLKPEEPVWRDEQARLFLAHWPERVVVLRDAGQVALLDPKTGEAMELLDMAPFSGGVSNPINDAVLLASSAGKIVCLRPTSGKPLTLADFQPGKAASVPRPADTKSDEQVKAPAGQASAPRTIDQQLLEDPLRSTRRLPQ